MQRRYACATVKGQLNLATESNAYFETCLALTLIQHRNVLPALDMISEAIIHILETERTNILANIKTLVDLSELQKDLYNSRLGYFPLAQKKQTPEAVLDDMLSVLKNKNGNLVNIIPIHIVFSENILPLLDLDFFTKTLDNFKDVQNYIDSSKEYLVELIVDSSIRPTSRLGIVKSSHYAHAINSLAEKAQIRTCSRHTSMERMRLNPEAKSTLAKQFRRNNVPIVGGPCTDMLMLMVALRCYENRLNKTFTPKDIREYSLANFAFQTVSGEHSFHEVMAVAAKCLKRNYNLQTYSNKIPYLIRRCHFMEGLKSQFYPQLKRVKKKEKPAVQAEVKPEVKPEQPVAPVAAALPENKSSWQSQALIYGAGSLAFFGAAAAWHLLSNKPMPVVNLLKKR